MASGCEEGALNLPSHATKPATQCVEDRDSQGGDRYWNAAYGERLLGSAAVALPSRMEKLPRISWMPSWSESWELPRIAAPTC